MTPEPFPPDIARVVDAAWARFQRKASWQTCVHRSAGLCPTCQAAYDADPLAWIEFGDHAEGLARWRAELRRIEDDAQPRGEIDQSLPF